MSYQVVETVDELIALDFQNCYSRYAIFDQDGETDERLNMSRGIILVGKPVIAAFLGISEKTLKRWFVKYPQLPVERNPHRCCALTDDLIMWSIKADISKFDQRLVEKAKVQSHADRMGVSYDHVLTSYKHLLFANPDKKLSSKVFYKKSVDKVVNYLNLLLVFKINSAFNRRMP